MPIISSFEPKIVPVKDSNLYSLDATQLERLQPFIRLSLPLNIYPPIFLSPAI